jgi:proteasome lid subunit RPN8/RPN11
LADIDKIFGNVIAECDLKIQKAQHLLYFLCSVEGSYVHIVECRQKEEFETIIIELGVERPQKIVNDIKSSERIAIVFSAKDIFAPEVFAMREDFPLVSHLNLRSSDYPKCLCLYEETYETIKLTWTPSKFINQIQNWLNKTSIGKLHAEEQPLEPFIIPSANYNLIIPKDFNLDKPKMIDIFALQDENHFTFLLTEYTNNKKVNPFVAIGFKTNTVIHGILRHMPIDLQELCNIFAEISYDFNREIGTFLKDYYINKSSTEVLDRKVLFIFSVPMRRTTTGNIERTDYYAFITDKTLNEIGIEYGVYGESIDASINKTALLIGTPKPKDLSQIGVCPIQIQFSLDAEYASFCNDTAYNNAHITAIGMGAIGSQIVNNLIRSGFGKWKLVDDDVFLPHNSARHLLYHYHIGFGKAIACRNIYNWLIGEPLVEEAIAANILHPSIEKIEFLKLALEKTDFIFDFSASIAVSRYIASNNNCARSISAYLTPDGKALVVACEDEKRNIRLDWLEMLQYREIINNKSISNSLNTPAYHRYGNSCRDISVQLSQDDFAIWSGFASKKIRELVTQPNANLSIFYRKNYNIRSIICKIYNINITTINGWEIIFDDYIINKMAEFRINSLPNETGGILLGNIDTFYKHCYIVDVVKSPLDSEEQPTSYVRGFYDLHATIEKIEKMTLEQISYIGEWHSHPKNCSVNPSKLDISAYLRIQNEMKKDALPAIMMIVGDNKEYSFVNIEFQDPSHAHP